MNDDNVNFDETESVGGSMIRLHFREWIMAPQFEYLDDAPPGESETCDMLSPEAVALERADLEGRNAKRFLSAAYSSFDEFKKNAGEQLLFVHVYKNRPSDAVLGLFSAQQENQRLLLLDVAKDRGFLKNTPITIEIAADRRFLSKPLAELRGLGAWAKGTLFGFEENESQLEAFVSKARAFAHCPK